MEKRRQPSLTPDIKTPKRTFLPASGGSSPVNYQLGLEKLQLSFQNKQLVHEIGQVSNKINAILKMETKTKEKVEKEKLNIEETLKKKARNEMKIKIKESWLDFKKKEVEDLKKKNYFEKEKRKMAIKALQSSIIRERQDLAREVKKSKAELDSMGRSFKEMLIEQKIQMKSNRKKEVVNLKKKFNRVSLKFTEDLKQAYKDRIEHEKKIYLELLSKKKELEKKEAEVIRNYSNTLNSMGLPAVELGVNSP